MVSGQGAHYWTFTAAEQGRKGKGVTSWGLSPGWEEVWYKQEACGTVTCGGTLRPVSCAPSLEPHGGLLVHGSEEEADGSDHQRVGTLIQQLGGEDTPDEEVVAQGGDHDDVGSCRRGAQQCQAEAAVAQ